MTIGLTSDDTTEGTLSDPSVTFTSGDWDSAQTVTVTGVDDDVADGDIDYSIVTAAATSSDDNYNSVNPDNVTVTNTDDEVAGITVEELGGNTITSETQTTQNFSVVLDTIAANDALSVDPYDGVSETVTATNQDDESQQP